MDQLQVEDSLEQQRQLQVDYLVGEDQQQPHQQEVSLEELEQQWQQVKFLVEAAVEYSVEQAVEWEE